MRLQEIHTLITSSTRRDWNYISCWGADAAPAFLQGVEEFHGKQGYFLRSREHTNLAVFRENVDLSLAWGMSLGLTAEGSAREPDWAEPFEHRRYRGIWLDILWAGRPVDRHLLARVEILTGIALLPVPEIHFSGLGYDASESPTVDTVTTFEIELCRLVDSFQHFPGVFDQALERAAFIVDDPSDGDALR